MDTDSDGDFSDETACLGQFTSGAVGAVGLLRGAEGSTVQQFDDFKIGYDNNTNGDIADAGDDIQIDDNFSSNVLTLVHDDAGNLTDDGVLLFSYDAWNRLVGARRRLDAQTSIATYYFDGLNRRIRKTVSKCGVGIVPGSDTGGIDGIPAGDHDEHYYYSGWRAIEERDNSANTLAQTVYGTEYIDAPVCRDRNTDVTTGGSADGDCLDSGGSARYFYHQDANFRVVAMMDESAAVVERYDYDAYGEPRVYAGGSAESGALRMASAIGNPYLHQGLRWDNETGLHENRYRMLHSRLGRFMQRDPLGYVEGLSLYVLGQGSPVRYLDPLGLEIVVEGDTEFKKAVEDCLKKLVQDPELKKIIEQLRKSKHKHIIKKVANDKSGNVTWTTSAPSGKKDPSRTPGEGCGATIQWNPKLDRLSTGPDNERPFDPCASLAHELSHARDRDSGSMAKKDQTVDIDGSRTTKDEEDAIQAENRGRYLCGNEQRTCQGNDKVNPGPWPPNPKDPASKPTKPSPTPETQPKQNAGKKP